jgi:hypothetical protein
VNSYSAPSAIILTFVQRASSVFAAILTDLYALLSRGTWLTVQVGPSGACLTSFQIRVFAQKFYQFLDGVSQHHRDVDDLLAKVSTRTRTRPATVYSACTDFG